MGWTGQNTGAAGRSASGPRGVPRQVVYVGAGIFIVLVLWILVILGFSSLFGGERTPDDVVEDFREAGLDVGESFPLEEETKSQPSVLPKTYEDATRFVIPSLGRDSQGDDKGGRVFSFENQEDLDVVRNHYESLGEIELFGKSLGGAHLYEDGLILVQINNELPKEEADRYGEVLEQGSGSWLGF